MKSLLKNSNILTTERQEKFNEILNNICKEKENLRVKLAVNQEMKLVDKMNDLITQTINKNIFIDLFQIPDSLTAKLKSVTQNSAEVCVIYFDNKNKKIYI